MIPCGGVKSDSGRFFSVGLSPKTSERAAQARCRRRRAAPGSASKKGFSTLGLPLLLYSAARVAKLSLLWPLWRAPLGARAQANLCAAGDSLVPSSPSLCVVTDRRRTLNTRTTFRVTALYV